MGDSDFALFLNTVNYLGAQENLIGIQALLAVVGTAVWWKQQ